MMRSLLLRLLLPVFLMLYCAQGARADEIDYIFQGYASGSIGSTSFTNSAFTITLTADTSNISQFAMSCLPSPCTIYDVAATSATITADGLTTNITSPIGVYDNQTVDVLGLSRITGPGTGGLGMDLLSISNSVFATYNLSTPIAAVGPVNLGDLSEFSCSAGCVITGIGDVSMSSASQVTFTDPVPEPASVPLLAVGLLAVVGVRRTMRGRARA